MLLRQVIVGSLLVAVLVVLVRTVLGTPAVRRIAESFANGGSAAALLNTSTECPSGSQIYMYEGTAFCCNGRLNTDADTVGATCRPLLGQERKGFVFCTLGPSADGVANCLELRAGLLAAEQEKYCPPQMPNFVRRDGSDPGSCCASPADSAQTVCADPTAPSCAVSTDANEFKSPQSCQYLKAVAAADPCPTGYTGLQTQGAGAFAGLTLYGCTDMGQNCYPAGALARLKELGYDTTGLTACGSGGN
ncbi:hypothetical protein EBX31_04795 [bacterium]|nr:hypothetical protein [bacterium]